MSEAKIRMYILEKQKTKLVKRQLKSTISKPVPRPV